MNDNIIFLFKNRPLLQIPNCDNNKQTLVQEGAAIIAFKLVRDGVFQEEGLTELLQAPGKLEGNFGTRNLFDNISDLKAQVAANQKGANLMHELVS